MAVDGPFTGCRSSRQSQGRRIASTKRQTSTDGFTANTLIGFTRGRSSSTAQPGSISHQERQRRCNDETGAVGAHMSAGHRLHDPKPTSKPTVSDRHIWQSAEGPVCRAGGNMSNGRLLKG
ncbi:unnamed protein product [Soboliphyme baturini]|uniref:Integron gene cassette protein n=1 Tax=Soboliphyme baturini TaxID=241478 RepID=A0A183IWT5_9BILA|nr:unnamed protein product [Soboliphyme baturini]